MKSLDSIFAEADQIIADKANAAPSESEKTASVADLNLDASMSLTEEILAGDHDLKNKLDASSQTKVASEQTDEGFTAMEKIAHAVAIVDTLLNITELQKLEKVASVAQDKGFSESDVDAYIEKKASEMDMMSIAPLLGLSVFGMEKEGAATKRLGELVRSPKFRKAMVGLGLAGAGGTGYREGKKSGYDDALSDVRKAFEQY